MEQEQKPKKKPNRRDIRKKHAYVALVQYCDKNGLTIRASDSTGMKGVFKRQLRTYEVLRGSTVIASVTYPSDTQKPICPPQEARYNRQHYNTIEALLHEVQYLIESQPENFYSGEEANDVA